LKAYWDEVFFQAIEVNPYYTCSINEALEVLKTRHNRQASASKI